MDPKSEVIDTPAEDQKNLASPLDASLLSLNC